MQLIITYIIVFSAVAYILFKMYEFLFINKSSCSCGGACSLKSELTANYKKKPVHSKSYKVL